VKSLRDHDDEVDDAAIVPANVSPHHIGSFQNKNGTLSVFFNGRRMSGERLDRSVFTSWFVKTGTELPCTCCKHPDRGCQHDHNYYANEEDDEDDENEDGKETDEDEVSEDKNTENGYNEDVIGCEDNIEPDVYQDK
jgi:hypothetical protein